MQNLTRPARRFPALGVPAERLYVDHGRLVHIAIAPGWARRLPPAAPANALVVTKLDRLARSLPDARASSTTSPTDIKDDRVEILDPRKNQRPLAVGRHIHDQAVAPQAAPRRSRHPHVVLYDQQRTGP